LVHIAAGVSLNNAFYHITTITIIIYTALSVYRNAYDLLLLSLPAAFVYVLLSSPRHPPPDQQYTPIGFFTQVNYFVYRTNATRRRSALLYNTRLPIRSR
jgi:hypothetical protein